jgi:hypothetical protein
MPAFAADEFQIHHDIDLVSATSAVLFPIPDECELKSVQVIADASPSATVFILSVTLKPMNYAWNASADLAALIAAGGVLYDIPPNVAGPKQGIPERGHVILSIGSIGITVATVVGLILTFRRVQQDGEIA